MVGPATDADVVAPVLTRHHISGPSSARGLLFTILGEFVLPAAHPVWTAGFLELLARLGIEEKAARQALMRTATDGWLVAERVGRRTRWRLTDEATQLLTDGTRRIFSFTGAQEHWDGSWVTVHARVPERDRATRHLIRSRLGWAGFGNPSPSLWISTHTERRDAAEAVITDAGLLDALIFEGRLTGGQSPDALVAGAWDLDDIDQRYQHFVRTFDRRASGDPLVLCTELVHAWRRFPWTDPALPPQFLPRHWHGRQAAQLFALRHADVSGAARRQWSELEAE